MIRTIRHKGLKRLFEQDDPSGVNPEHVGKLRNILATLNAAPTVARRTAKTAGHGIDIPPPLTRCCSAIRSPLSSRDEDLACVPHARVPGRKA